MCVHACVYLSAWIAGMAVSTQGGRYCNYYDFLNAVLTPRACSLFPFGLFLNLPWPAHQESCWPWEAFSDPLQSARTCFVCKFVKASGSDHYRRDCCSDGVFVVPHVLALFREHLPCPISLQSQSGATSPVVRVGWLRLREVSGGSATAMP